MGFFKNKIDIISKIKYDFGHKQFVVKTKLSLNPMFI